MILIKDKNNNTKKGYISATDVQLLDIEDKFKHKNLEDALKEVGSGTEQNMLRIEDKVDKLDKDKSNILNKFNEYGKKDGTLQTGLNAEKINGITKEQIMFSKGYTEKNINLNTITQIGVYSLFGEECVNLPSSFCSDALQHSILNIYNSNNVIVQELTTTNNTAFGQQSNITFKRVKSFSEWSEWKQLATTETVINFTNKDITPTDANLIDKTGLYRCSQWTNIPSENPDSQGLLKVELYSLGGNGGWYSQTFISPHMNRKYVRVCVNGIFSPWEKIATTETKTLTLLNGWQNFQEGMYSRVNKTGDIINIQLHIKNGVKIGQTVICNVGYSLSAYNFFSAYNAEGIVVGSVSIDVNGDIRIAKPFNQNTDIYINIHTIV